MVFFRGFLFIDLIEAQDLPDCDTAFFNIDPKDTSDPFAQVKIGNCVICKTGYINNDQSPKWQESYRIPVCHEVESVRIMVLDKDHVGAGTLGEVELRPEDLIEGETIEGWHPLSGCDGQINFKIFFVSKDNIQHDFEVPDCYFTLKEGNKVSLYQDAYCPALPFYESIQTMSGDPFVPQNAWVDLYTSISQAQQFIYVTGWSVNTDTILLRDCNCDMEGVGESFGQLLIRKASDGVRVLVLIWNEKMSTDVTPGLMGTHDEETRDYFEGSDVEVAVVPRVRTLEGITSFIRNQFAQTCYTHHQKSIIVDAPIRDEEEKPRILAYLGGLDVTNGRWDTPEHNLYRTLKDLHNGDFYNGCVQTTPECGPRQPWHDIHCKIEGPGAKQVLDNFVERWRLQASDKTQRLFHITNEEFELEEPLPCEDENSLWSTQLLRSITSDSAMFDFERSFTIPKRKGKFVDDSIHRAYIHHIRRADRFIYIENQYFLGSAYAWQDETDTKAYHIIPQEITQRIVEKINAGEDFRVYIVVPMYPEGDPASKPVQEILHWQHRTMEMMYIAIAKAIEENEVAAHPTDYLLFFCLGKRESPDELPEDLAEPEPETPLMSVKEHVRFMIYVHSKMMIVDDDYIIVGSANINQRSMGGTRDSEIAVGAFQPNSTRETTDGEPRGAIHQFRLSLWGEHLGSLEEQHIDPGTFECMQSVKGVADENLAQYISEEPQAVEGHLMTYPVKILDDGNVEALEDCDVIPDLNASILGAPNYLPNKLTT